MDSVKNPFGVKDSTRNYHVINTRNMVLHPESIYGNRAIDTFEYLNFRYIRNVAERLILIDRLSNDTLFNIPSQSYSLLKVFDEGYVLGIVHCTSNRQPMAIVLYNKEGKKVYCNPLSNGILISSKKLEKLKVEFPLLCEMVETESLMRKRKDDVYIELPPFQDTFSSFKKKLGKINQDFHIVNNLIYQYSTWNDNIFENVSNMQKGFICLKMKKGEPFFIKFKDKNGESFRVYMEENLTKHKTNNLKKLKMNLSPCR